MILYSDQLNVVVLLTGHTIKKITPNFIHKFFILGEFNHYFIKFAC